MPNLEEELFLNGDDYFESIFEAIIQAQSSIDIETYIFSNDAFSKDLLNRLAEAQKRGVKVRLLLDAAGSAIGINQSIAELRKRGIEFRIYRPFFVLGLWGLIWNFFRFLRYANQRNHRKAWFIDQKILFLSSMNISQVHLKKFSGSNAWKDYGVKLKELSLVTQAHVAFEKAWKNHKVFKSISSMLRPNFSRPPKTRLSLNYKFGQRRKNHLELLKRIKNAKDCIWFANPYFTPDFALIRSLQKAAKRGIDVRVVVPKNSDVFFVPWVSQSYYFQLIRSGVKIYEFQPQMLHGKLKRIDSWYQLGSSNLNRRSLFHDLELDVELALAQNKDLLQKEFEELFRASRFIQVEDCVKPSLFHYVLRYLWGAFRYWL